MEHNSAKMDNLRIYIVLVSKYLYLHTFFKSVVVLLCYVVFLCTLGILTPMHSQLPQSTPYPSYFISIYEDMYMFHYHIIHIL